MPLGTASTMALKALCIPRVPRVVLIFLEGSRAGKRIGQYAQKGRGSVRAPRPLARLCRPFAYGSGMSKQTRKMDES